MDPNLLTDRLSDMEALIKQILAGNHSLRLPERDSSDPFHPIYLLINELLEQYQTQVQEKLSEQRRFFENILDQAPVEVVIFDPDCRYVYVNAIAIKNPDVRKWIIGKTDRDWAIYRNRSLQIVEERQKVLEHVRDTRENATIQQVHQNAEGKNLHYFRRMVPVIDDQDKVEYIFGFGLEITDLKEKEAELLQTNEELKKINYELDQFVYRASHDMRAPLLTIEGMINLAEHSPDSAPRYLNLIRQSVQHLDSLIRNIVDYSKNSHLGVVAESIDLKAETALILNELILLENASDLHHEIKVVGEGNFGSDAFRFRNLIKNLLSNAIRYRDPGKAHRRVYVGYQITSDQLHIRIEDNGQGIDEEHQARMFDIFFRGTSVGRGSGLGLFIAKEIVDRLGGSLSFQSKAGEGTTFEVRIPNLA